MKFTITNAQTGKVYGEQAPCKPDCNCAACKNDAEVVERNRDIRLKQIQENTGELIKPYSPRDT